MAKRGRPRKLKVELPTKFEPQFFSEADGRSATIREIRRRYEDLKKDTGANSYQKDLLCQRATFIAVQLETMECIAAERGKFNAGTYTQMVNTLIGLLKSLGLEKKAKQIESLSAYVESIK